MLALKLLGEGRTAKIYEYTSQSIAKIYNDDIPTDYIEYEIALLRAISGLEIKTAKYRDYTVVDGRPAIIMDRIDGRSFFSEVLGNPLRIHRYVRDFIDAQQRIHAQKTTGLPTQKARFRSQVLRSGLDRQTLGAIEALIDRLPDCDCVCHGDFHPGNIIASDDGLFTIDWMNAYRGNPIGDVFRSYLMFKSPFNPLPISGLQKFAFMRFKQFVANEYLRRALRVTRVEGLEKKQWLGIIAAVRLCDKVPNEEAWLLHLIRKALQ